MSVDPFATLGIVIETSVTLAGFSGVVVVLGKRVHGEWGSELERSRLTNLLVATLAPMFLCLTALALLHAGISEADSWRVVSIAWIPPAQGYAIRSARLFLRASDDDPGKIPFGVFLFFQVAIVACSVLQIINAVVLGEFWPFLVSLILALSLATFSFHRLLDQPIH